jgi:hypothetical protein
MGQDVERSRFDHRDFERFARCLRAETEHLHALEERGALSAHAPVVGLELAAWLVAAAGRPAPRNDEFLAALNCPEVVTELGRFNIELNVPPRPAAGDGLARLGEDLRSLWDRCQATAANLGLRMVAIGILPSLADSDLSMANLSDRARYRALNEQVRRQRHGRPVRLAIDGPGGESLRSEHHDVMLEAAATSFQVHLQLPTARIVRAYNAALLASAPLVAVCGNSPLLFGRRLWRETRIPLFEQALGVGTRVDGHRAPMSRVGFGSGYAGWSLLEPFRENLDRFEPLLPLTLDESPSRMPHLRLHNGTIWRWNRPLVGFDADACVHLRLEHRPLAAGPSLADTMADLAFAVGLIAGLAALPDPPEAKLPFDAAQGAFYAAARDGLAASLPWPGDVPQPAARRVLGLLPLAAGGLAALGVAGAGASAWLATIEARAATGRTGAEWQLRALDDLHGDVAGLTLAYAARQAEGLPVHRWRDV